jgi:hypothetical protein
MSLLEKLATTPPVVSPPQIRYDTHRQVSQVLENGSWVDSWHAASLAGSKKFDIETGEDAKGR